MEKSKYIMLVLLFLVASSCMEQYVEIIKVYSPVYMSYEDFRQPIKQLEPRQLENTGKIYFKDNLIFINEELKGVHVIDNTDPANPKNTAFIEIEGNMDIAIKGHILYADSYIDLIALDISNLQDSF